jgi:hypothetical protein
MNISVNYDDTDVAKALSKIIKDPNSEEFVKLITPMICSSAQACNQFFKLMLGNKLPDVMPVGTLCKLEVSQLGYGSNKDEIRAKYADADDKIVVKVKEFRGYHEYSDYEVTYNNIKPNGDINIESTYTSTRQLDIIEEI